MSEQQPVPEIKHTYSLEGEDRRTSSVFSLAAATYAETRADEEKPSVKLEFSTDVTVVTFGRKVLEVLNRYEFDQTSDRMRNQIEGIITSYGGGDIARRSYAGMHVVGPAPERE